METKKVIVLVGQCPINDQEINALVQENIGNVPANAEVNVFDLPRVGGHDTGRYVGNVFVHRYACPTANERDAVQRDWEIVRDVVALGPCQCIFQTNVEAKYKPLMDRIRKATDRYGINQ